MVVDELKRVIKSKRFIAAIIIALIISALGIYFEIKEFLFFNYDAPDLQTAEAKESARFMVENGLNKYGVWFAQFRMFIVAMPIISVLPFGLSFVEEKENGIIKQIDLRINHKKYINSKIIVNSIAGGLAVIISTIILTLLIFIIFKGNIEDFYGYGSYGGPFSGILVDNFFMYIVIHIIINFIFGAAYASIGLAVSSFINNKIAIILSPFIFWITGSIICSILSIEHYSTSLINQFYVAENITVSEIFIELILILIVCSIVFTLKTKKEDIYEK